MCLALWQHPCPLRLLRRHLSQSERLWHSVTFSGKRKSVLSKTKPLCQGLSCQESCRADARLRGWTKDAFRVSGITQVLLCTTSPTSSLRSMPPLLAGEALAFRDVFQQTQIGFIENESSLPRALLPGELSSGCETERLDKGRLSSERNNAGAALYNLSVIFASLDATSPVRGGFGEEALCISPIHTGIYYTDTTKWVGGNGICLW